MDNVRNPDGIWINTELFRESGNFFMKNNGYNFEPVNSPMWYEFWKEERNRCINGYSVGGAKITGEHYFYLNYCPIKRIDMDNVSKKTAGKKEGFPYFWDADYNYFWIREIARKGILQALNIKDNIADKIESLPLEEREKSLKGYYNKLQLFYTPGEYQLEGGLDLIVLKARRKGLSYKNASISVNNLYHRPRSYTLLLAYEKKYLYPGEKTLFGKCLEYINFLNLNTAWVQSFDYIEQQGHIKASYKERRSLGTVERGLLSEIEALSGKDNPDVGRGGDAYDIFGEEAGAWGTPGGLKDTVAAIRASSTSGKYKTGMITLFGTSGNLQSGTVDFAEMFENPVPFGFMSFQDVWGDMYQKTEGFFLPKHLGMDGFYDRQGNSQMKEAKEWELSYREKLIKAGASSYILQKHLQEEPLNSGEALAAVSNNTFPVVELKSQLDKVIALKLQETRGTPVQMSRENGKVVVKPLLYSKDVQPITTLRFKNNDIRGCPVIYEFPKQNPPRGLYKIGYDPIRQDSGTSLAGLIVYKGTAVGEYYHDNIVAEYIGRYEDPDDIDRLVEMFCDYFNTTVMHENEVTGVKNYFRRIHRLNLLAGQPDAVISKSIKHSTVSRVYGCHMTESLKDAGERYIKTWLLSVIDYNEHGEPVTVIDRIYSRRLLEELINYTRKGNFDLVSALIMCMFQVQEDKLGKKHEEEVEDTVAKQLVKQISKMYLKRVSL